MSVDFSVPLSKTYTPPPISSLLPTKLVLVSHMDITTGMQKFDSVELHLPTITGEEQKAFLTDSEITSATDLASLVSVLPKVIKRHVSGDGKIV